MIYFIALLFSFSVFANNEGTEFRNDSVKGIIANSERLIRELKSNRRNIIGVELALADKIDSRFESSWGHSLIRFVDNDKDPYNDIVISFSALIHSKENMYLKATFGAYNVIPDTQKLRSFISTYMINELRTLKFLPIQTTPDQRAKLIANIANWLEDPQYFGKYTFISNNCMGVLKNLLLDSGIKHYRLGSKTPTSYADWAYKGKISTLPERVTVNPQRAFLIFIETTKLSEEQAFMAAPWTKSQLTLLGDIDPKDLVSLYQNPQLQFHPEALEAVVSLINKSSVRDKYNLSALPKELYQVCEDLACAEEFIFIAREHYGEEEFLAWSLRLQILSKDGALSYRRATKMNRDLKGYERVVSYPENNPQKTHFELIIQALK